MDRLKNLKVLIVIVISYVIFLALSDLFVEVFVCLLRVLADRSD